MSGFLIGVLFGIFTMISFGVQDFLMAKISRHIGSFRTSLWFVLLSFIVFIVLALFLFTGSGIDPFMVILLIITGFVSVTAILSFTKGLEIGNVSIIATVGNTWGAITALLGFLILGQRIGSFQILDICLIIIGTVLVSLNLKDVFKLKPNKFHLGLRYAFVAAVAFGLYFFLLSFLTKTLGWFDTAFLVTIPMVLFLLLYGTLTDNKLKVKESRMPLLFLIGILSIVGLLSYNLGVTYNYTDIVAPVSSASPLVTIILAFLFLKERLTNSQKIGVFLILLGLVLLSI